MADLTVSSPPASRRGDDVDLYHGVPVADPYRWLENGDSPEVDEWVAAHNQRTRQALDAQAARRRWHERLSALAGSSTVMSCAVRGNRLFSLERAAGANQYALVLRSAVDADVAARVLVDPAGMSPDGASAIDFFIPSHDGSLVAYGISEGGTEEATMRILVVDSGDLLDDAISHLRHASVAWRPDLSGFWYACYPPGDQYGRHIRYHAIGTSSADDVLTWDRSPTPETWPDVSCSDDGRYVLVTAQVGWGHHDVHLLDTSTGVWQAVTEGVAARSDFVFHGGALVGVTTRDAPNGQLVTASVAAPGEWRTVVAERDVVLGGVVDDGGTVLLVASVAGVDVLERWAVDGTGSAVGGLGVVSVQSLDADAGRAFVTVTSFDSPSVTMRLDSDGVRPWVPVAPDAGALPALVVSQRTYHSLDGTEIGAFVVHRADLSPDADTPMILTGYGGFAINESPVFSPNLVAWCAEGGAFCVAGLRGGYEHGERWHHAGRRGHKQNVFDDFLAAADWLVGQGHTSPDRLAIVGGSNGGLLVGASLVQRPDVARAVWCAVPLLDMVRFPQFLIARLWTDEYGDPGVAEEFGWLAAYSPYHHVVDGQRYPAVLFTTAEGDTRVDPLHARKMAARMIEAAADQAERPVLLLQAGRAGHGAGKPTNMRIDEGADVLTFLSSQLECDPA